MTQLQPAAAPAAHSHAANDRIAYLDGLRGVAILAVIGFHYFTCFQSMYPYGSAWSDFPLFRWGYYGVHLFFAISGFVIALTLERCGGFAEFAVRRFARLWPTMLLCSVITYAVLSVLPTPWPQSPVNFLPSLTFIDGQVWNKLIPGLNAEWIDVAYWSLFVEVRFYLIAALLWFAAPRRFHAAFFVLSTAVVAAYSAFHLTGRGHPADLLQWAFAAKFLPWFAIGIAARLAAQGRRTAALAGIVAALAQNGMLAASGEPQASFVIMTLVIALMFVPLHSPRTAALLGVRWLAGVGAASYSLYLLHQYAGVTIITAVAAAAGLTGAPALAVAVLVALAMIAVSRFVYARWESPLNARITRVWTQLRQGAARPAPAPVPAPAAVAE